MANELPNNVLKLKQSNQGLLEGSGGPPHDSDMDKRLARLEALVPTLATKADVEKASHDVTKWVVGTMVAGVGIFIVLMTFVLNNAVPKQQSAPSANTPIIIQLPTPAPTPAPAPPSPPAGH